MNNERTKNISFRCSEKEYMRIRQNAEALNLDISTYIRARVLKDYRTLHRSRKGSVFICLTNMDKELNQLSGILGQADLREEDRQVIEQIMEAIEKEGSALWQTCV